ncbi:MAG: flagellar hook-associated protein FlgK [Lachnospiraceae bacterium]|nr:flagellar hook-associated protein FlgK [Lachnospiraceae bacterium]
MSSTFFGLNISKTGLSGFQASINTTAHNVSNAATEGYSRQVVTKSAEQAIRTYNSYGSMGAGVNLVSIDRQRNEYYDTKYWNNQAYFGQYSSKADYMGQIENYFNEVDTDGFTTEFNNLFNSLVDLTSEPGSSNKRVTVASYAGSLSEYFNALSSNLTHVQEDANDRIKSIADRINSIADQLLSINKQVQTIEITGENANDLRDQRDLLIDELSGYVNVQVVETDVYVRGAKDSHGDPLKAGITDVAVYINDQLLVDSLNSNHLVCTPRTYLNNINDCEGLYDLTWNFAEGDKFDLASSGMDGELKGLFDIRDGNNKENFNGIATVAKGATEITVYNTNATSVNRLNIPDEGVISVASNKYEYDSFTINYNDEGQVDSYSFKLKSPVLVAETDTKIQVAEDVDFKGIPYYQYQLNEFVRTFAQRFNELHNKGVDEHGDAGLDFFTAANNVTGKDMVVTEEVDESIQNTIIASDADSYYRITAANIAVNKEIARDGNRICTRFGPTLDDDGNILEPEEGIESCELLKMIVDLKGDNDMFSQGNPAEYLQAVVADISVDCSKAKNFESSLGDVLMTINNQRESIKGVDSNEELANLVIYQKGYNLCSKMISVFNEIYNKLINETGL